MARRQRAWESEIASELPSRTEPPVVRERLRAVLRRAGRDQEAERVPGARDTRTRERALQVLGTAA
jgi:hypothetical protein